MKTAQHIILVMGLILFFSCGESDPTIYSRLSFEKVEGLRDSILIGSYSVYADRTSEEGRKIPIHVAVSPAIDRENLREPIFIIEGGPGVGAFSNTDFFHNFDTLYRRNNDIVYIDVRGTGKSQPLICPELQTNETPQAHFGDRYPLEEAKLCIERYRDSVDFNHYNTKYIVEDLDEIREWLGYDKINLYSVSYGGKVALKYMDMFPESLNRSVLHAPAPPWVNSQIERAIWMDTAIEELFRECKSDSLCNTNYPELEKEFNSLHRRFRDTPVEMVYDEKDTISLTWYPIVGKLNSMLYAANSYVEIPYLIHEAYNENYTPLLESMDITNDQMRSVIPLGLYFSIMCKEEIGLAVDSNVDYKNTYLSSFTYDARKDVCDLWPVSDESDAYAKPIRSDIPALIISGRFDPVCPPGTGKEILSNLSNARHIVIPNMGHLLWGLDPDETLACYDQYLVDFYNGEETSVDLSCFQNIQREEFKVSL